MLGGRSTPPAGNQTETLPMIYVKAALIPIAIVGALFLGIFIAALVIPDKPRGAPNTTTAKPVAPVAATTPELSAKAEPTTVAEGAYKIEERGMHAGKITRDRDAILSFNPVGVWAVPQDDTVNSPTVAFMYVYPDGSLAMLKATDCKVTSVAEWELDYGMFRIIDADGSVTESVLVGVPGKRHIDDEGNEVYGWGQRVLFGTARYWYFASPNVASEC